MHLYKTGSLEIVALGSTFLQLQSFHFPPRAGTIPAFQVSPFVSWSLLFYQICICTSALSWDFKHTSMHKLSKPTGNRKNCKAMRNPLKKEPWSALEPDKQLLRPGRPSPSPTSTSHGAHNCLSRPSATGTLTHNAEASSSLSGVSSSPEWTKLKWKTRGRRNHEAGCQLGARRNLWRLHILILKRCFSVFLHLIFKMKVWKSNGC